MEEETITISKREYKRLIQEAAWLACLVAAGVDNWSGWDEAVELRKAGLED